MNSVVLIGNLGRDPEMIYVGENKIPMTKFTLAVSRQFKDASGNSETDWFTIITWRQLAENVAKWLKKGRKVGIRGSLQTRTYDRQDGVRVTVTEIVADEVEFLTSSKEDPSIGMPNSLPSPDAAPSTPNPSYPKGPRSIDELTPIRKNNDGDMPF
ncbi:MAG: single-stranded DNA-binding protein [Christensenellaceae bacterium]|jgi:single-strand DNA-binding protein|nr:single-stranded DNA-binding protein [Christensenellaceae bacterium]